MRFTLPPRKGKGWKRRLREYALVLPVIYAIWCGAAYFMQDRFIFPRGYTNGRADRSGPPRGAESVWIEIGTAAKPARVEAWYFAAASATADHKAPAVVYFHGNAELIDWCADRTRGWRERGYAVLIPEYRGYGRSGGTPSQAGIVADAGRFYDLLAARPEVDPSRILIHGRSLGGGVACQLAAVKPCAGLILESTFASIAGMSWSLGVPPFLVTSPFHNDRVLAKFEKPVLLIHGQDDNLIPPQHGRALHGIARGSMLVELPGGHNDFPRDWRAYWAAVDGFLKNHAPAASPQGPQ